MHKLKIAWMYPNLLNLHGERGSIQALVKTGENLGLEMEVVRIEDFSQAVPFQEFDLVVFLPGEMSTFRYLIPALQSQKDALDAYLLSGGYLLALGTSGLMFGKTVTREDQSSFEGLGYLDMCATERKYVWGDDLHFRLNDTQMELVGPQIQMADVDAKQPLGTTIYGRGNNATGAEGARWKNLIYTNCLGPLFVKNPWFAEDILKNICLQKFLGLSQKAPNQIAADSFRSTLSFIQNKPKEP